MAYPTDADGVSDFEGPVGSGGPDADLPSDSEPGQDVLFEQDAGVLADDTRRVLVALLQGPFIDGRADDKLWQVVVRDENVLRSRLHELFLELVLDRDYKVCFLRQVRSAERDFPVLLRRSRLTYFDSVLLLELRQKLLGADADGMRAVVAHEELLDAMSAYAQVGSTDQSGLVSKRNRAIQNVQDMGVLKLIPRTDKRYEISPVLRLLFSAEDVEELIKKYRELGADRELPPGVDGEEISYGSTNDEEGAE